MVFWKCDFDFHLHLVLFIFFKVFLLLLIVKADFIILNNNRPYQEGIIARSYIDLL